MNWMVENGDPREVLLLSVQADNKISMELHCQDLRRRVKQRVRC
jgi:hypothetical protein